MDETALYATISSSKIGRKDKCSWLGGKGCEKMNLSNSNKSTIFNPNSKILLWL
jgi:hypothetical protein